MTGGKGVPPAGTGPAGPPGASRLEAGQPPGLAVLTIQGARRSLHAGLLPLPTQALDRPEPQLGPEAECVPTHPNFVRRKAGQDGPRLPLLGVPDRRQGATAFCGGCAESGPAPDSRGIRTGKEGAGGQPPTALGAESDVFRIPHVGMPAPRSWPGAGSEPGPVSTISDWPGPAAVPLSGPSKPRAFQALRPISVHTYLCQPHGDEFVWSNIAAAPR